MVCLAPHVKKVSMNPRLIFDGNLNLNGSGRFVFLCRAECLQDIFAETDLCDGPSFTRVFAACVKSVWGLQNLPKTTSAVKGVATPADMLECFRIKPRALDDLKGGKKAKN